MSRRRPPLIGLPGRRKAASQVAGFPEPLGGMPLDVYPADYASAVVAAGGLPVHLPLDADPAALAERLDGILLTGGADIEPGRYGADAETDDFPPEPQRDDFEAALIEVAASTVIPVLGVCRGLQLLNVEAGGTLHQDVPAHAAFDRHQATELHTVSFSPGSALARLYAEHPGPLPVNSLHHQTVDRVGRGYAVTATADDGVVEGIEHDDLPIVAVQWHPEMMTTAHHDPVFGWLVDAASVRAGAR